MALVKGSLKSLGRPLEVLNEQVHSGPQVPSMVPINSYRALASQLLLSSSSYPDLGFLSAQRNLELTESRGNNGKAGLASQGAR